MARRGALRRTVDGTPMNDGSQGDIFGAPVHRYTGFNAAAIVRALGLSVGDAVVQMPDGKRLIIGADALDGIRSSISIAADADRAASSFTAAFGGARCSSCGGPHRSAMCPRQRFGGLTNV